jgi:hypothetical protein
LLGTTALTTPAFATGNQCHYNCTPTPPPQGGGDVDIDNNNKNTAIGVGVGVGYGGKGGEGGDGGHGYGGNATGGNANNTNVISNSATGGKVEHSGNSYNNNENKAYGGTGVGYGGDAEVKNSGNSYNHIDNKDYNANVNVNAQKNTIKDSANNHNYNSDYNYNKNEQDQQQKQKQQQQQQQKQEIENSGNSYNENDNSNSNNASQSVNTYNERAPVNTAYAAGLSVGEDTCMGSSSFGAQAVSFGLSIGTTWQDDNCRRLKNSRQLVALGYHRAGTALMCVDEDVKNAMIMAGTPCPNGQVAAVYIAPTREYQTMAPVADEPRKIRKRKVRKALPPK